MSDLPLGWCWAKLGDVAELASRSTLKEENQTLPVLTFRGLKSSGTIELEPPVTHAVAAAKAMTWACDGDTAVTAQGHVSGWVGKKVGHIHQEVYAASTLQIIRPLPALFDARFLTYFFNRYATYKRLQELAGARTSLSRSGFLELDVALPPLNEQRRIVAATEAQLSRLDAADAILVAAGGRAQAFERGALSSAIAQGDEAFVGDLLLGIEAGKSFKCHGRPADANEWGVIKVSAMTWGFFDERQNKAVLSGDSVDPRWEIRPGDLLLSRANTTDYVGASVLVPNIRPRLLLSDKSMRLQVRPDIDKAWLQFALSSRIARQQMSAMATGTSDSMRNISQDKVKAIRVRVPPLDGQRRVVQHIQGQLSGVHALDESLKHARHGSASLRRAVLQSAFRGELVPQDPTDEPAAVLVQRIRTERGAAPKQTRHRNVSA